LRENQPRRVRADDTNGVPNPVQAVAETGTPLAMVAAGTGNDFAKKLGLPTGNTARCVEALLDSLAAFDASLRSIDAICVTGPGLTQRKVSQDPVRWVAGAVSAGLDAAVNERANSMLRPRGSSRYVVAALREIAAWDAWDYRLTFENGQGDDEQIAKLLTLAGFTDLGPEDNGDGRRLVWDSRGALVTAANGSHIGGGIPVAPDASIDDGLMDIVIASDVGRSGATTLFPMLLSGKHLRHKQVRIVRARAVQLDPATHEGHHHIPSAFGDGEHLGTLPLRAQVHPGGLKVLV
jgi:diacylglycerol kinase (ATP)